MKEKANKDASWLEEKEGKVQFGQSSHNPLVTVSLSFLPFRKPGTGLSLRLPCGAELGRLICEV